MKKLLTAGLMLAFCCLAIYLASLTGCSADRPTENNATVMSLNYVHDEYGDELLARDTAQGVTIDIYELNTDSTATVVVTYRTADSCMVSVVSADGTINNVTKPFSEYTRCLINGIAVCDQWYDKDKEPVAHAQCVARVMVQCACWDTLFSWLYGKLAK